MAPETLTLRPCEGKLVEWIRRQAVPYGAVKGTLTVEYQDGQPVLIRVGSTVEIEEKLR